MRPLDPALMSSPWGRFYPGTAHSRPHGHNRLPFISKRDLSDLLSPASRGSAGDNRASLYKRKLTDLFSTCRDWLTACPETPNGPSGQGGAKSGHGSGGNLGH